MFGPNYANAQTVEMTPPYVTTVSRYITNDEIFYIGGKTDNSETDVIIYTQNLSTGETQSYQLKSNKKGEWFYRHDGFLSTGKYMIWTQSRVGDEFSPPSPQIEVEVSRAAFQFGSSRISFETFYLGLISLLLAIMIGFVIHIIREYSRAKRRHSSFMKEIKEAEESVKRGFAVVRRDIQREIDNIRKIKMSKDLLREEKDREEQLLRDLENVERKIGQEIWDVERLESHF